MADGDEPLDVIAQKITAHASKSNQQIVAAALLADQARRRVASGEAGDVTWTEWAKQNIGLSPSRVRELVRIGGSSDPLAELERIRRWGAERVRKHRAGLLPRSQAPLVTAQATPAPADERAQLIMWARSAPIEQVRKALAVIIDVRAADPLDIPDFLDRRSRKAA